MAFGKVAPIHLALFFGHLRFRNEKSQAQAELERGTLETGKPI
jgi:hypothetical protein